MKGLQWPRRCGALLTGLLMVASISAFGQSSQTVKGEVLDMSCYMGHGAKGKGHQQCAQKCLDKGLPAGLLTSSGKVYLLVEDHSKAKAYESAIQHAADQVQITGKVVNKNGMQALVVEDVKTSS